MKKAYFNSFFNILFYGGLAAVFVTSMGLLWPRAIDFFTSPCDLAIHYRIDRVDPAFGLERDQFAAFVNDAVDLWEEVQNRDLFVEDSQAVLTINLESDGRQALRGQVDLLEQEVANQETTLEQLASQYQSLLPNYNARVTAFNEEVDYWNSHGGAPDEVYDRLTAEQTELNSLVDELNNLAESLNLGTGELGQNVTGLNEAIDTYNSSLSLKPEQGVYRVQSQEVIIYFLNNEAELTHTVAHELGHVLELDHVDDKQAIMYPFTTQTVQLSAIDQSLLNEQCDHGSGFEQFKAKVKAYFDRG